MTSFAFAAWSPPDVPLGKEIVSVLVGPEAERFGVHHDLICASSKFFASAFTGGFAETKSKEIFLADVDPKLFAILYQWLYSAPRKVGEPLYERTEDDELQPDELLLNIYHLADYLLVPGLQLLAIEQLKAIFSSQEPTIPSHDFIFILFGDDRLRFLQTYVLKHMSFWISKCEDKDTWMELIIKDSRVALGMATEFANLDTIYVNALKVVHPSKISDFEAALGLSLAALTVEARENDREPTETSGGKVLGDVPVNRR